MDILKGMLRSDPAPLYDQSGQEQLKLILADGVEFEQHIHFQVLRGFEPNVAQIGSLIILDLIGLTIVITIHLTNTHSLSSLYVKRKQRLLTDGNIVVLQSTRLSLSENLTH